MGRAASAPGALTPPRPVTELLDHLVQVTSSPVDEALLQRALTHRSYAYEAGGLPHNERLEFLGDSVLGLVVTETLYAAHPDLPEGQLAKLRAALNKKYEFVHPEHPQITGLSHIQWTGKATKPEAHARNAVFYGDKAIDRSPCGTGTSARMAQLAAKGKLAVGDEFVHESIIGSLFKGRVEAATTVANRPAIIPSIAGWARMTGYNTIFIDDRDPFAHGFVVT